MRIASYGAAQSTISRANACSSSSASAACTAPISEHVRHSHQLSASMSSSRGSRPASRAVAAIATQTAGPKHAVKRLSVCGRRHGGCTSSTSWPSATSSVGDVARRPLALGVKRRLAAARAS